MTQTSGQFITTLLQREAPANAKVVVVSYNRIEKRHPGDEAPYETTSRRQTTPWQIDGFLDLDFVTTRVRAESSGHEAGVLLGLTRDGKAAFLLLAADLDEIFEINNVEHRQAVRDVFTSIHPDAEVSFFSSGNGYHAITKTILPISMLPTVIDSFKNDELFDQKWVERMDDKAQRGGCLRLTDGLKGRKAPTLVDEASIVLTTKYDLSSFAGYEEAILETAEYPGIGQNVVYPALGLGEEAGEVMGKIKKIWRLSGEPDVTKLVLTDDQKLGTRKELGDALWYLARTAAEIGSTLEDIARENIAKILDRKARGVIVGEGDNR